MALRILVYFLLLNTALVNSKELTAEQCINGSLVSKCTGFGFSPSAQDVMRHKGDNVTRSNGTSVTLVIDLGNCCYSGSGDLECFVENISVIVTRETRPPHDPYKWPFFCSLGALLVISILHLLGRRITSKKFKRKPGTKESQRDLDEVDNNASNMPLGLVRIDLFQPFEYTVNPNVFRLENPEQDHSADNVYDNVDTGTSMGTDNSVFEDHEYLEPIDQLQSGHSSSGRDSMTDQDVGYVDLIDDPVQYTNTGAFGNAALYNVEW